MIAEAIAKILELSEVKQLEINGEVYTTKQLHHVKKREQEPPDVLVFSTLSGMVDFVQADIDEFAKPQIFLHIVNYDEVSLVCQIQRENGNQRFNFARSVIREDNFSFDRYLEIEEFIVSVQSGFIANSTVTDLLSVIGNLANEVIKTNKDDGVSQAVQVKSGITTKSEVTIENPLMLQPFRTFREIEQPSSNLIFRLKNNAAGGLVCALFEADGGKWKIDAIENIKTWLKGRLPDFNVIG